MNSATGLERTTQAAPDGTFHVTELPVGTYTVTVTRDGFEGYQAKAVKVEVASNVTLTVVLPSGNLKQEVVVNADAVQLERTTNTLGETLTQETVKNLPVN